MSPPRHSVWELVKEEIDGGNLAVPDDYEIGSGPQSVDWISRALSGPLSKLGNRFYFERRVMRLN